MSNQQIKACPLSSLRSALEVLAEAHTRDDAPAGFVVEFTADVMTPADRHGYIEAWRVVREALGYETAPEAQKGSST